MPPREFGALASRLHEEALTLRKEICGGNEEYNKWMHIANRHQITCIEGMKTCGCTAGLNGQPPKRIVVTTPSILVANERIFWPAN
jgi:hypothetical protein